MSGSGALLIKQQVGRIRKLRIIDETIPCSHRFLELFKNFKVFSEINHIIAQEEEIQQQNNPMPILVQFSED